MFDINFDTLTPFIQGFRSLDYAVFDCLHGLCGQQQYSFPVGLGTEAVATQLATYNQLERSVVKATKLMIDSGCVAG